MAQPIIMYNPFFSHALWLIISVGGNLSLSWFFLAALLSPLEHAEFIKNTSILIFLIEFLSIHSSGFAMGFSNQEKKPEERDPRIKFYAVGKGVGEMSPFKTKLLLIGIYSAMVIGFGFSVGNWTLPFIFFISLIAKFFGQRASDSSGPERFGISVILLIFLTILTTLFSSFWGILFPFPSEVRPFGSGTWVDYPQDVVLWGVLYYFSLAVIDVAFYFKREKNIVWKPFYYISVFFLKIITFFLKRHPDSKKLGGTINFMQKAETGGFDEFLKSVSRSGDDGARNSPH